MSARAAGIGLARIGGGGSAAGAALRPTLLLTLLLALWLGGAAAQDYYPSQAGASWTYSSGETQTLSGPRDVNGRQVMVLTHFLGGVPVSEDYLDFASGVGVQSVGTASGGQVLRYSPPLQVYAPEPLAVGQQWQSTTEVEGLSITLTAEVLGMRGVRTSAGRFNALQIRQQTLTSSGARTVLDLFFVPTVGVVRFVTQDGTVVDLIEKNF